jgi:hypothetical protein
MLALAAYGRPISFLQHTLVAIPDLFRVEDTSTLALLCLALDQQQAIEKLGVAR